MSAGHSRPAEPLVDSLTRREREILALLAQGHTGPEIADRLMLALSSVRWYLQQLYAKLGANGRREAVSRAQALGLLETLRLPTLTPPNEAVPASIANNLPVQLTVSLAARLRLSS